MAKAKFKPGDTIKPKWQLGAKEQRYLTIKRITHSDYKFTNDEYMSRVLVEAWWDLADDEGAEIIE